METLNFIAVCNNFVRFGLSDDPVGQIAQWQDGNPYPIELVGGWAIPPYVRADVLAQLEREFRDHAAAPKSHWFRISQTRAEQRLAALAAEQDQDGFMRQSEHWSAAKIRRHQPEPGPGSGSAMARAVVTPHGQFPSANAAAAALGISRQAVSRNALRKVQGWRYV